MKIRNIIAICVVLIAVTIADGQIRPKTYATPNCYGPFRTAFIEGWYTYRDEWTEFRDTNGQWLVLDGVTRETTGGTEPSAAELDRDCAEFVGNGDNLTKENVQNSYTVNEAGNRHYVETGKQPWKRNFRYQLSRR